MIVEMIGYVDCAAFRSYVNNAQNYVLMHRICFYEFKITRVSRDIYLIRRAWLFAFLPGK